MTAGSIILVASVLVIFVFGVFMGYKLSERRLAAQERRQVAAQSSLYRQLRELQAARRENRSTRRNVGSFS
jgi:hypothetical protein